MGRFVVRLRNAVFWPPFLLLFLASLLSFVFPEPFITRVRALNDFCLTNLGWAFSAQVVFAVLSCLALFFSPLGKIRIGGENAKPILNRWRWFSITLCTTVAVGILFWAAAEPIYHLQSPPKSFAIEPNSPAAVLFAQAVMYLHWSIIPYALYSVPMIMFAIAYFNKNHPFSLRSILFPFASLDKPIVGAVVDALCLYSLVLGMAGSLGTGLLTLSGGVNTIFGTETTSLGLALIATLIVAAFCISASTGLLKGIRILSDINVRIFFGLALFVLLFGNTLFILEHSMEAMGEFISNFFKLALFTGAAHGDTWPKSWSLFYWASWLAWAPITALFLGKLTYGYTIRECLLFNWIIPSGFACVWTAIFSGQALSMQTKGQADMTGLLQTSGPETLIFTIFEHLPLGQIMIAVFLFTAFLSYVTAADSNTEALGQISTSGTLKPEESPSWKIKVVWGVTIGLVSYVMTSFSGVEGLKILSNLGGVVSLFLIFVCNVGLVVYLARKVP